MVDINQKLNWLIGKYWFLFHRLLGKNGSSVLWSVNSSVTVTVVIKTEMFYSPNNSYYFWFVNSVYHIAVKCMYWEMYKQMLSVFESIFDQTLKCLRNLWCLFSWVVCYESRSWMHQPDNVFPQFSFSILWMFLSVLVRNFSPFFVDINLWVAQLVVKKGSIYASWDDQACGNIGMSMDCQIKTVFLHGKF